SRSPTGMHPLPTLALHGSGVEGSSVRLLCMRATAIALLVVLASCAGREPAPAMTPAAIETGPIAHAPAPSPLATDRSTFKHRAPVVGDVLRVHTDSVSSSPRADGVLEGERYISDYE